MSEKLTSEGSVPGVTGRGEGSATTCDGNRAPPPFAVEVQYGKHRINIQCPHIEGGACGPCIAVQLTPYIAAKEALTWMLPRLDLLAASLSEMQAATVKLANWGRDRMAESWTIAPDSPLPAPADECRQNPGLARDGGEERRSRGLGKSDASSPGASPEAREP